ncbi:unnamed protein product [Thlaspi arvense]|uniref:Phorbol-ester/DAG-type domain-containing protein n=1 Tax=Thlaspi arvense TaxID=13288 RepID=A0AAU9RQZ2_THLAR|nr:unnamed protein product [Thlaspi arvense]
MDKVLFPRHYHSLSDAYNEDGLKCDACDGSYRAGKYCDGCKFTVHRRCVFLFYIKEKALKHPSHVGHRLKLLTTGAPVHSDPRCHLCGKNTKRIPFRCSTCKLNLDIDCMLDALCGQAHVNMPWHPHPLLRLTFRDLQCCLDEGFMYVDGNERFDVLCSSITVPFIHGSHPHPLFYLKLSDRGGPRKCKSCAIHERGVVKCDFYLDFRCATLPLTVRLHRYDDHSLTLCYGEEASGGKYWCDICETETHPETWFYTCKDCGVALHVLCVLGDLRYAKPGGKIEEEVDLIPNDTSSRPLCYRCHCRCIGPFILKNYDSLFLCSVYCLSLVRNWRKLRTKLRCPPWALEPNT